MGSKCTHGKNAVVNIFRYTTILTTFESQDLLHFARICHLNIAQVKQKHGIIERENYNKPKSPDSKQPGCPEKKVKAIEDAMRHFQMI